MNTDNITGPVNLGNPTENTIHEVAQMVLGLSPQPPEIIFKELPQDDPKRRKPDISRAISLLDWKPQEFVQNADMKWFY